MKHVVILGAGISGLAVAWFLKQRFSNQLDLTILEKSSRAGGWIKTIDKEGFLFELGPRSCRSKGTGIHTLQLIEQLGLQSEVISADPAAYRRFIYMEGDLLPVPHNFFSLMTFPLLFPLIKGAVNDLITKKSLLPDESIHNFVTRRFSHRIATELFDPLTSGIYAGDTKELSMKSCFPQLFQWEQEHGSVIKGAFKKKKSSETLTSFQTEMKRSPLFSFKGGMETLPKTLAHELKNHIWYDSTVHRLPFDKADLVISTINAPALGGLLAKDHAGLSELLKTIKSNSVTIVSLGYKKSLLRQKGFGYLIPSKEQEEILGMVWDSCVFPQQNKDEQETRLTVMIAGLPSNPLATALHYVLKHLNISALPDTYDVKTA